MTKETEDRALTRELTLKYQESEWIGKVLTANLSPIPERGTICSLGVGCRGHWLAIELLHIRDFVGPQARLYAFDIEKLGPEALLHTEVTNTKFHRADIRDTGKIIKLMGGEPPNLVICRHPRVIKAIDQNGIVVQLNKWWAETLTHWGLLVRGRGQMLVTTFTEIERDIIAGKMRQVGLAPTLDENDFAPSQLSTIFARIKARFDGFTIKL